jgi:hypothetical protein
MVKEVCREGKLGKGRSHEGQGLGKKSAGEFSPHAETFNTEINKIPEKHLRAQTVALTACGETSMALMRRVLDDSRLSEDGNPPKSSF